MQWSCKKQALSTRIWHGWHVYVSLNPWGLSRRKEQYAYLLTRYRERLPNWSSREGFGEVPFRLLGILHEFKFGRWYLWKAKAMLRIGRWAGFPPPRTWSNPWSTRTELCRNNKSNYRYLEVARTRFNCESTLYALFHLALPSLLVSGP